MAKRSALFQHLWPAPEQMSNTLRRIRSCLHFMLMDSWLNQVELWFSKIERQVIVFGGVFRSVPTLSRRSLYVFGRKTLGCTVSACANKAFAFRGSVESDPSYKQAASWTPTVLG